jgi:hypothetical protein
MTTGKAAAYGSQSVARHQNRFARIESNLAMLKWMTGTILSGVVALVIKTFFT